MKSDSKAIIALIVILMYIIGAILFFVNLFDGTSSDAYFTRVKLFCALMVGATILGSITKVFIKDDDGES